ncbi:hypothetical protein Tdes44962_MAKER08072 [Teratosphaeria destructans]|uniref:Uncharacterized protein n=1 Tax=Teratosphaeria destructans TaxID=418781 RepID=A0A9W7W4Z9_9PEZI|nr:hypothetical protein Tdes44962_MAKER08072 [Teratosphaeria destructans]
MKTTIVAAAAIVRLAVAGPAALLKRQQFDYDAVLNAPSPTATAPPIIPVNSTSSYSVDTASIAASISSGVTTVATASITGYSASAASTLDPPSSSAAVQKRGWGSTTCSTSYTTFTSLCSTWGTTETHTHSQPVTICSTSSSSKSIATSSSATSSSTSSSSSPSSSAVSPSRTLSQSSVTISSASTACPTQPEAGTYCGFINPEDACAPQPTAYGPTVTPDTVAAFEAYQPFHDDANHAQTPSGYVEVFKDLNASTSANSYLTYETLTSYDVTTCAKFCDDTDLCTAFNIYIERDPSVNPTSNGTSLANVGWGTDCPNPSSVTNYKCSLWGSSINAASATNYGQWRDEFQVVIVASNGYDKTNSTTPPSQTGWGEPQPCSGGGISAGGSYWMGSTFYPGPFDTSLCATYAEAQTAQNKRAAQHKGARSYVPCNMFNAYAVHKNGVAQGTYCQLFDAVLDDSWASFEGAWSGSDYFGVQSSWTYALSELDDGKL